MCLLLFLLLCLAQFVGLDRYLAFGCAIAHMFCFHRYEYRFFFHWNEYRFKQRSSFFSVILLFLPIREYTPPIICPLFFLVSFMCVLNVIFVSSVTPRYLVSFFHGISVSLSGRGIVGFLLFFENCTTSVLVSLIFILQL